MRLSASLGCGGSHTATPLASPSYPGLVGRYALFFSWLSKLIPPKSFLTCRVFGYHSCGRRWRQSLAVAAAVAAVSRSTYIPSFYISNVDTDISSH